MKNSQVDSEAKAGKYRFRSAVAISFKLSAKGAFGG